MAGWHFQLVGWPWWAVLPLAVLAFFAVWRWLRPELAGQPPQLRRGLLWLRGLAVTILVLLFLEPTLSKTSRLRELPLLAVLIDQSASMEIKDPAMGLSDQLDEAVALGLVPAAGRPRATNGPAQVQADTAWLGQAAMDSPVAQGLARWGQLSRFERATLLTQTRLLPWFTNRARVSIFGFDQQLAPLSLRPAPGRLPGGVTDFEGPLSALARLWSQEHVGAVLVLSDGRQTAGRDPAPVARALQARGAKVAALWLGDVAEPPDAQVAEVSGSGEVFLEEPISLEVKHRILGDPRGQWDLLLFQNGREVDRRQVHSAGPWQYEHFEVPARQAGVSLFQARLERSSDQQRGAAAARATGSVTRELWLNLNGSTVDDLVRSGALQRKPDRVETLRSLASAPDVGDNYGSRIRGFLSPPTTGPYTFWVASDDASSLWLGPSPKPPDKALIASVPHYTSSLNWDAVPSQRSPRLTLKAGQAYYFEVLHKEGSGGDHVAVGWQLPDGTMERPIPGHRLSPWTEGAPTPQAAPAAPASTFTEATLANNQAEFSVAVNQDPIRVFLADATPRWESRYLAALFERDRRVQLDRRYHSLLLGQDNLPLLPRTQEEWNRYDLVVLGDLDSSQLGPQQQRFALEFVARRGGFLVAVAGPRGMPRSFSLGALASLLPVKVVQQTLRDTAPVTLALTDPGKADPITLVLKDPTLNQRLWPALPPLQWIASSVAPKPGATVLLEAQNPVRTPVVAYQRFGAGRVLWLGTGESWRWRDRLGDRVHQTFWLQAVRWGLAARLRGKDPRLQVSLDRSLLAPGEVAELRARATWRDGRPSSIPPQLRLEPIDAGGAVIPGAAQTTELKLMPDGADLWQHGLRDLPEGQWRATVTCPHPEFAGLAETRELLVRSQQGQEVTVLSADPAALARLTEAGGHRAGSFAQAETIARDLAAGLRPRAREQVQTHSLWDNYLALLLILGLLCAEWIWRKRRGLP